MLYTLSAWYWYIDLVKNFVSISLPLYTLYSIPQKNRAHEEKKIIAIWFFFSFRAILAFWSTKLFQTDFSGFVSNATWYTFSVLQQRCSHTHLVFHKDKGNENKSFTVHVRERRELSETNKKHQLRKLWKLKANKRTDFMAILVHLAPHSYY